jgi:olefin beta-lactone synthetase
MNITDLLLEHARVAPQRLALIDLHRKDHELRISFGDCVVAVDERARALQALGLRQGQAVLVFQPMSADLYVTLGALFRLGLVAMVVDPAAGLAHLAQCCELFPPSALIATPKAQLLRLASPALRRIPITCVAGSTSGLPIPGAVTLPAPRLGSAPLDAFTNGLAAHRWTPLRPRVPPILTCPR